MDEGFILTDWFYSPDNPKGTDENDEEPPRTRKQTKMEYCDLHAPRFASTGSVYRRVEVMLEGGWGHSGACEGGRCKLFPGTDYICRETCEEYGMDEMPLEWTKEVMPQA